MRAPNPPICASPRRGASLTPNHLSAAPSLSPLHSPSGTDGDFDVVIDGDRAIDAMLKWRAGARSLWVQEHDFACPACCSGGN